MTAHATNSDLVSTCLGPLHIGRFGAGPPAVLWHSLWVDSRSWGPLVDAFAAHRQVVTIDGPGYGLSSPIRRDFTLEDCVQAACEVLDALGVTEPVDWVGNAWGGHVGITLAATRPHRLRSLVTIAAPVTPVGRTQRWTQTYPLALLYRLLGPNRLLTKVLFDVLLGSDAIAAQPDRAAEMMAAFRAADRESIWRTIRFMHSWRPLTDKLRAVTVPTVLITGDLGGQHWRPADAQAAAATMPTARAVAVTGSGHVGPLLVDVDQIASTVIDFWNSIP
ncbi:alpha/beta fold hydrolase [Mycobacterium branderi]|uniref:Alpha/beta hydrolase n=1 Tax=Mycobacterium branderi TaxID=43348 RepID=A0A7I7W8F2_9MYCO|nr:alpha/beta hydrolase [Mycobacterium branderi]MCV7231319.1 alpha/beta hydrolase [Mycobacterium branderi]ORA31684.1 alpha/beta hydrolase [Mycobacterium branderi]BBZ12703.1 putative hydrolase, alpha/beta fold protein [Mycobacterium branderi]